MSDEPLDHERSGPRPPLDDTYNLVPLTRDEVAKFVADGFGDVLVPRLFRAADGDDAVCVDGYDLAAVDGRPVFFVGLRKVAKPVAPFGLSATWLRACAFLDPATLRCRVHGDDVYPSACATYPGENLLLGRETECERVERVHGHAGERLLESTPPDDARPLFGPQALGAKVFAHPDPERLAGVVARAADDDLSIADCAEFVGVAVASSPGSLAVDVDRAAAVAAEVRLADSWAGRVVDVWTSRADDPGTPAGDDAADDVDVEEARGAPETTGW